MFYREQISPTAIYGSLEFFLKNYCLFYQLLLVLSIAYVYFLNPNLNLSFLSSTIRRQPETNLFSHGE